LKDLYIIKVIMDFV